MTHPEAPQTDQFPANAELAWARWGPAGAPEAFHAHFEALTGADSEAAIRQLTELVTARPDWIDAWLLLGHAYTRTLDLAAAAETARRVLAIQPGNGAALTRLGFCLFNLGDHEGALEVNRRLLRANRNGATAILCATSLHRLGRFDEAREIYDLLRINGQIDSDSAILAVRNLMHLERDLGRPLAADGLARELIWRCARQPLFVPSKIVGHDQSTSFHEWFGVVEKARLADLLREGLAHDPRGRVPPSFNLPQDREALASFAAAQPAGTPYIVKPVRGSGGQGISLTSDPSAVLDRTDVVVQRYIDRPYVVDGRKGHLRIYACITSVEPLRAYIYREGVVRFAPEPYDPRPERLGDVSMHVTNTALHHGHPNLQISDDPHRDDVGSIWSLSALLRRMAADGRDPDQVFGEIKQLVEWFFRLLRRQGLFARHAAAGPPRAFGPKLLGFDILLDADAHPWLIEIQTRPAAIGSPLVTRISGELFGDMFNMTVAPLLEDGMDPAEAARLLADPALIGAREAQIERQRLGRFAPLELD